MPPRTTAASIRSEEHDRRISELERHMLTSAGKHADIEAQQKTNEEVCGERYRGPAEDIAELKSGLKDMGSAMANIAKKMTERLGGIRAVREVVAYVIAGIIAPLYSRGLLQAERTPPSDLLSTDAEWITLDVGGRFSGATTSIFQRRTSLLRQSSEACPPVICSH
jgi:hypothetical protein